LNDCFSKLEGKTNNQPKALGVGIGLNLFIKKGILSICPFNQSIFNQQGPNNAHAKLVSLSSLH